MSECPFTIGHKYKAKSDFGILNHQFKAGDILTFLKHAYDPHNGVTRYWFRKQDSTDTAAWHVWDTDEDVDRTWTDYFTLCG